MQVLCKCGLEAVPRITKKEGQNKGRVFMSCPRDRDRSCNFFIWEDEVKSKGAQASPYEDMRERLGQVENEISVLNNSIQELRQKILMVWSSLYKSSQPTKSNKEENVMRTQDY